MPRSEGIETPAAGSSAARMSYPERMPRSEGIETRAFLIICNSCIVTRNECPDKRGLRLNILLHKAPRFFLPERMPRSEGIETIVECYYCIAVATPGTNAPIRGD